MDVEPAPVARREQVEEGLQQGQRLPVQFPGLGLGQRLPESVDSLGVAGVGRPYEVGGAGPRPAGGDQRPGHVAVQRPPAGAADAAVHRFLDERMAQLVGQVTTLLELGDQAEVHQPVQQIGQRVEGLAAERDEFAEGHPRSDHRRHLQHVPAGGIELAEAEPHPLGEVLGQQLEGGTGRSAPSSMRARNSPPANSGVPRDRSMSHSTRPSAMSSCPVRARARSATSRWRAARPPNAPGSPPAPRPAESGRRWRAPVTRRAVPPGRGGSGSRPGCGPDNRAPPRTIRRRGARRRGRR